MPSRYAQWMYDWEHRLTSVDNNRVVRPLEWGTGVGADLALPQRVCSGSRGRESRKILSGIQPPHRRCER